MIGVDGNTSELKIVESSGKRELDRAIISIFATRKYHPATIDGKPVAVRLMDVSKYGDGFQVDRMVGIDADWDSCFSGLSAAGVVACAAIIAEKDGYSARISRGRAYQSLKRYGDAMADFDRAIQLGVKDNAGALRARGFLYEEMGNYDRAIEDYSAAIAAKPSDPVAVMDRALTYEKSGKRDLTVAGYKTVSTMAARCVPANTHSDETCRREFEAQIAKLDGQIADDPNAVGAYANRCARRALANQQLTLALADCNHVLNRLANEPDVLESRGLIFFRMGSYPDALEDYDASLASRPNAPAALYLRGVTKLQLGDKLGGHADMMTARLIDPAIAANMAFSGVFPAS